MSNVQATRTNMPVVLLKDGASLKLKDLLFVDFITITDTAYELI